MGATLGSVSYPRTLQAFEQLEQRFELAPTCTSIINLWSALLTEPQYGEGTFSAERYTDADFKWFLMLWETWCLFPTNILTAFTWHLRNSNNCLRPTMMMMNSHACKHLSRTMIRLSKRSIVTGEVRLNACAIRLVLACQPPEQKHWRREFNTLHSNDFMYRTVTKVLCQTRQFIQTPLTWSRIAPRCYFAEAQNSFTSVFHLIQ